jgi:cyclic pyranopterin phosphate synthase
MSAACGVACAGPAAPAKGRCSLLAGTAGATAYNPPMVMPLPILDEAPQRPAYAQGPRSLSAVKLLRLSITDRCNLRCVYCMPAGGIDFHDRRDLLSAADILAVARAAHAIGVEHFKVTGGEPTVRGDVLDIVAGLAALKPRDLSMTTNGLLLDRLAGELKLAGLRRLTVSCDSLRPDRFDRITGGAPSRQGGDLVDDDYPNAPRFRDGASTHRESTGNFARFERGLEAACRAGFPVKLNVVVMGGINDDEVVEFARLTLRQPWTVRFIEYMPLGESVLVDDSEAYLVDNAVVRQRIELDLGPLRPVDRDSEAGVGPANVFALPGARGRLGFISAMSKPFCETCNRLRLTATGELRSCLFDGGEVSVLPALRPAPDPAAIVELMRDCVAMKPAVHSSRGNRAMSQMGG